MPDDRIVVFIDYQNVYHRARASFFEGADPPVQVSHVHPLKIGDLLCNLGRSKDPGRVLAGIQVYRAVPDNRSGANLEQASTNPND
ncbi:MAG: hypothetical protein F4138_01625 [Acidimicrobiia bacterium]|nr:hypothetical protein [Acidimicrobiia bacterium]MYC57077.1 hypothetical protein [Acidimicrobiia bacterium]MYG93684.1 hypothetical protein [Acidimicrobiia bacterium]MYI30154.1 hypothetical protein [Acidimicrobiia bacterium]